MAQTKNEASTWGEMLVNYRKEKNEVPWKPEQREPVRYVSRYEVSRKEREFDPILQQYRETKKERNFRQQEQKQRNTNLKVAKSKQVLQSQSFDIINHVWKLQTMKEEQLAPQPNMPMSRVEYNIISNKPFSEHHYAAPELRPKSEGTGLSEKKAKPEKVSKSLVSSAEFNIISNRYTNHHEERSKLDKKVSKETAAQRFWQTHDFNPVVCEYYDPEKEERFQKELMDSKRNIKERLMRDIETKPICIRKSEGSYYDIVSIRPVDEKRIKELDRIKNRSKSKRCVGTRIEHQQKKNSIDREHRQQLRLINRTTNERQQQIYGYANGYNIVNHRTFTGRGSQEIPKIRQKNKSTLWQRMETGRKLMQERKTTKIKGKQINSATPQPIVRKNNNNEQSIPTISKHSKPALSDVRTSGF